MRSSVVRTAAATLAFCALHSLLASRPAKRAATRWVGERRRNIGYRPLYVATSFATAGLLYRYVRRQPDRTLYALHGPPAWLLQALRLGIVAYGATAVGQIGAGRMLGLPGLQAGWAGAREVPPEPEAQGPALGPDGRVRAGGPFRRMRHPLNALAVPVLWLTPRLTVNGLTFNLVATGYLYLGSLHEESRLRAAYGEAYEAYRTAGAAFFLPSPKVLPRLNPAPGATSLAVRRSG